MTGSDFIRKYRYKIVKAYATDVRRSESVHLSDVHKL